MTVQGEQSVYRFRFAGSGSWSQLCPGFYVYPESPHVFSPLCCWRKMSVKVNPILDVLCRLVFIFLLMYFSHVLATMGSVFMSEERWLTGWCPVQIVPCFGACINIKMLMLWQLPIFRMLPHLWVALTSKWTIHNCNIAFRIITARRNNIWKR